MLDESWLSHRTAAARLEEKVSAELKAYDTLVSVIVQAINPYEAVMMSQERSSNLIAFDEAQNMLAR
jgi:hypothetical protein